jgi:hypothetical protein
VASPYIFNNVGGSTGPSTVTGGPWYESGQRWFVHRTGSDSAPGLDRARPLATLAQAVTNASAGDTIHFLEGHSETLAAAQTLSKTLYLVSEGSGTTRASFTCSGAVAMFDVTSAGVRFNNLYFPQSTAAPTARVRVAAAECHIVSCDFDSGALDTGPALKFITSAATSRVSSCKFTSTTTVVTSQPAIGVEVANAMSGLDIISCTFDGGTYGWSDYALKWTAAVTRGFVENLSLLNGADFFAATGSSYRVLPRDKSGSSRMVLTA